MIESALASYYDQEGVERAERELAPERVAARTRFLATYAPSGRGVLEVGCGPGRDAAAFVEAGHDVHAVDLSTVFAHLAAATGAHVANATARALPFRDDSFDVVWSMSVLMHIPDDGIIVALDEIARVLRPGGCACIGVWGADDRPRVLEGAYGPRFFANRSAATWTRLLTRVGSVEEFEQWSAPEPDPFAYHFAVVRRTI